MSNRDASPPQGSPVGRGYMCLGRGICALDVAICSGCGSLCLVAAICAFCAFFLDGLHIY